MAVPAPLKRPDPPAALVSVVIAVLGYLGLVAEFGLTADDVAAMLGSLMTAAALVRALWPAIVATYGKLRGQP